MLLSVLPRACNTQRFAQAPEDGACNLPPSAGRDSAREKNSFPDSSTFSALLAPRNERMLQSRTAAVRKPAHRIQPTQLAPYAKVHYLSTARD